jgi:hypothetical protein
MKLKLGQQHKWGTTNSKPPGRIIMIGQSETLSSSHTTYIRLFSAAGSYHCCAFFNSHHKTVEIMLNQNQFPELNRHILTFVHPN